MNIKILNEVTREYLDKAAKAALANFRDAVRPIYGATDKGAPDHIGTALLLNLPEGRFLLTAAHVIDHNTNTTLYLGADDFVPLQFEALATAAPDGDRSKDHVDFAIACVDNDLLAKMSGAKFITEAEISRSVDPTRGRTYTCLGYPNSKNKVNTHRGTRVSPLLLPYTSTGKPASLLPKIAHDEIHVLVDYDGKYVRNESGAKVNAVALRGCSGGAIIDHGRISLDTLYCKTEPKLAALLIEAHAEKKVILGTRLSVILAAVRNHHKIGS